jgi:hypothetical protein
MSADDLALVTPDGFGLGWRPELEQAARASWARSGQPFAFGASELAADDRPIPEAFSLSGLILWHHNQGPVGTCYGNAGTESMQINTAADNVDGQNWDQFQLSRAFVCNSACSLDANNGQYVPGVYTVTSGGTVTNTLKGMSVAGACHETAMPYYPAGWTPESDPRGSALSRWLNRSRPSDAASAEGKINHLTDVVDLTLGDESRRAIMNGHPPVIGIKWPIGWDNNIGADGRARGIGPYARSGFQVAGHALTLTGFDNDWDGAPWWEIENSHGPIYHPIPAARQGKVIGYKSATPTTSFSFWVRHDWLASVLNDGWSELVAPAGMTGFRVRPKLLEWGSLLS